MEEKRVILITGVAGYWGSRMATRLLALDGTAGESDALGGGYSVVGLDVQPPSEPLDGLDFIQADVRNPLFVELLRSERIDTILHLAFLDAYQPSEKAFDLNVIGTMKVLGAAAEAEVRKVILRSSTGVYGAHPTNPAFLTENSPLNGNRNVSSISNLVEIEAFVNGFRRQSPEMQITILRFANIIGPDVDTPLTEFLQLRPVLSLLGFDPLMQIIHEEDVIGALLYSLENDVPGVFNIAAEGILPLGKLIGLAGRVPLPVLHPFAYLGNNLMRVAGFHPQCYFPIEPDFLRYPCLADLAAMRTEMGFIPTYTAEEALREFAGHLRLKKYKADSIDMQYDEQRLRDTLERRRRIREAQVKIEEE
jgi:UDP-glucose 4-epimerase